MGLIEEEVESFRQEFEIADFDFTALDLIGIRHEHFLVYNHRITKEIGEQGLRGGAQYQLGLRAEALPGSQHNNGFFQVGLRGGHNQLEFSVLGDETIRRCQAQEQIDCDPEHGYTLVKEYLDRHNMGRNDGANFRIKVGDDTLIFDDHDQKHRSFRGWTGGYDPSYTNRQDAYNLPFLEEKLDWDLDSAFSVIDKRLTSMEQVFASILIGSGFEDVSHTEQRQMPNFPQIYENSLRSRQYQEFLAIEEKLRASTGYGGKLAHAVYMNHNDLAVLVAFNEEDNMLIRFDPTSFSDTKGCCEIHLPTRMTKGNEPANGVVEYTPRHSGLPGSLEDSARYSCIYLNDLKETGEAFEENLRRLLS